ncbi:MAG TPA: pyrroline-5-carboxylate reductase [Candidatus Omnitrophota bacterium]|nr:pyrroline-5-carboxylate reductase [Candidatus Omnitrophota bacterium]HNQ51020.1 pyrroline-5-carboxylate reductase [Candidatus Omnitrophota bacterium]HQO38297.1 pyrroline-5-carboxylate reductase [Candidatus Omnitrophota bacterium]HQQ06189.1 pyrroline-5-carboxylate reductase [Candidatus Omnitrophota bacterium]
MKKSSSIGVIGFGNMGSAIASRLRGFYKVYVFEKDIDKLKNSGGVMILGGIEDIIDAAGTIIIAVKPQDFDNVLEELRGKISQRRVVSIAAGISTGYIEESVGDVPVIRVMPNLPAKVGMGMICLCKGRYALETDLSFAQKVFGHLGKTLVVEESQMNAVTAVSGSGPGFFFGLIEGKPESEWAVYGTNIFTPLLIEAAREIGFSRQQAQTLAVATAEGSIALLRQTGLSPQALRRQVTSKGGTTEAGLEALERTRSLVQAVKAAAQRAEELSGGN